MVLEHFPGLEIYGIEFNDPKSTIAQDFSAWASISSRDQAYQLADGTIDFDTYATDKDEAFDKLPKAVQTAIKEKLITSTIDSQRAEADFKAARNLFFDYYDIPKWTGVSLKDQTTLEKMHREVDRQRDLAAGGGGGGRDISGINPLNFFLAAAGTFGLDRNWAFRASLLTPGSTSGDRALNRDRWSFLIKEQDTLAPWYPELYRKRLVQGMLTSDNLQLVAGR